MGMDPSFFKSEEFRSLLGRYEQMQKYSVNSYFSTDDLLEIASYYLYKNNYAEAENVITYARKLYPSDSQITEAEVRTLLSKGEVHEARRKFATISVIDTPELQLLKAEVELAAGSEKTISSLNAIMEATNLRDDLALNTLDVMIKSGFHNDALAWIEKGLRRYPAHVPLLEEKADCLVEQRRMQEALALYNRLLDENPYNYLYWEQLGYIYYVTGRLGKALECFEYELATNDEAEYARMMKAYCYYYLQDYDTAYNAFCELSLRYPGNVVSTFFAALSLCALEKYGDAAKLFDELLLSGELTMVEAMITEMNKALICDRVGYREMAVKIMQNALSFDVPDANQMALHGAGYLEIHDKDSLLQSHIEIVEREPRSRDELLLEFALYIYGYGHYELAVTVLEHARENMYDSADVDSHLAYMLWQMGRRPETDKYIASAIEGRSNKLFELFGLAYDADITPAKFVNLLENEEKKPC